MSRVTQGYTKFKIIIPRGGGPKMYSIDGITADCIKRLSTLLNKLTKTPEFASQTYGI